MSRRAYLPIAVELPSRKGVIFEVLHAGTFNRVTVYQRTRAGLRRVKNPELVQRVVKEIERQNKAKDVLSQAYRAEQKSARYFYDAEAVRTKTDANLRNVWTIATFGFPEAHFATFPPKLVEPCIKAGCPVGGVVLDPFGGSGTVGLVASRLGRDAILIELNLEYAEMAERRIHGDAPLLADVGVSA